MRVSDRHTRVWVLEVNHAGSESISPTPYFQTGVPRDRLACGRKCRGRAATPAGLGCLAAPPPPWGQWPLRGPVPLQGCRRPRPKPVWPLSPPENLPPHLSPQPGPAGSRVSVSRSHQFLSPLLSENPGPGSIRVFSTIPQAAPDHRQNGPRTQPFLQQHNWLLK